MVEFLESNGAKLVSGSSTIHCANSRRRALAAGSTPRPRSTRGSGPRRSAGPQGQARGDQQGVRQAHAGGSARIGKLLNAAKQDLEVGDRCRAKRALNRNALNARLESEWIDLTTPAPGVRPGSLHPVTQVQQELEQLFVSMGFAVLDGPEVESEYYNFDALNIPADHPARDMQDTFWLKDGRLLRTHTSPVQVRGLRKAGAAAQDDRARPRLPQRRSGRVARAHVLSARRHDGRSRRFRRAPDLLHEDAAFGDFPSRRDRAAASRIFSVRRTRLRARHPMPDLRRLGLPGVQAIRMGRTAALRSGASGGAARTAAPIPKSGADSPSASA